MEHQKILNLLNEANYSKFVTRKWNIVNDNSKTNYDVGNEIICNTEVLKSNLCDYNDAYILVRVNITIIGHQVTQVACKNCVPFIKCIKKIDGTTIDDAEDLDIIMSTYNLIELDQIILKRQEGFGFLLKIKQLILMQILLIPIISNISCIRLNY